MSRTQKQDCANTIQSLQLDQDTVSQIVFPSAQKSKLCEKIPVCKSFLGEYERRSREFNVANRWIQNKDINVISFMGKPDYPEKAQQFIEQECKKEYPKDKKQGDQCVANLKDLKSPDIGTVVAFMSRQELEFRKFTKDVEKCKKAVGLSK